MSFWSSATKLIGAGAGIASGVLKGAGVAKNVSTGLDLLSGVVGAFKKPPTVQASLPAPIAAPVVKTSVAKAVPKLGIGTGLSRSLTTTKGAKTVSLKSSLGVLGRGTVAGDIATGVTGILTKRVLPGIGQLPGLTSGGGGDVVVSTPAGPAVVKMRKRYRRMNYGNARAAKRAIRRIKGVRKLLSDIERQLPRKTVRSRVPATRAGAHRHK